MGQERPWKNKSNKYVKSEGFSIDPQQDILNQLSWAPGFSNLIPPKVLLSNLLI